MKPNEEWTVDVVARCHRWRIRHSELAKACGYSIPYISLVLNGQKEFKSEKSKERTKKHILFHLQLLEEVRHVASK